MSKKRKLYKDKYRIKTVRLPWWNYSENGDYFITVRTQVKGNILGRLNEKNVVLNPKGEIVKKYIMEIPAHFGNVILRSWVVMPDHIHLVLRIRNKRKMVDSQHCCESKTQTTSNNNLIQSKENDTQQCCVSTKGRGDESHNEKNPTHFIN